MFLSPKKDHCISKPPGDGSPQGEFPRTVVLPALPGMQVITKFSRNGRDRADKSIKIYLFKINDNRNGLAVIKPEFVFTDERSCCYQNIVIERSAEFCRKCTGSLPGI
jgi:hypothetical protein